MAEKIQDKKNQKPTAGHKDTNQQKHTGHKQSPDAKKGNDQRKR